MDSSKELSTTSHTRWWRPISPVEPMYIAGRRRTASRPPSTLIDLASYLCPACGATPASSLSPMNSPLAEAPSRRARSLHSLCADIDVLAAQKIAQNFCEARKGVLADCSVRRLTL